jgi:hypothetical protein
MRRADLYANPDVIGVFLSLDPHNITRDKVFHMLDLVCDAQAKVEEPPLKFSVSINILNELADDNDDIVEILEPVASPPKMKGKKGKAKVAASSSTILDFTPAFFKACTVESTDNQVGESSHGSAANNMGHNEKDKSLHMNTDLVDLCNEGTVTTTKLAVTNNGNSSTTGRGLIPGYRDII